MTALGPAFMLFQKDMLTERSVTRDDVTRQCRRPLFFGVTSRDPDLGTTTSVYVARNLEEKRGRLREHTNVGNTESATAVVFKRLPGAMAAKKVKVECKPIVLEELKKKQEETKTRKASKGKKDDLKEEDMEGTSTKGFEVDFGEEERKQASGGQFGGYGFDYEGRRIPKGKEKEKEKETEKKKDSEEKELAELMKRGAENEEARERREKEDEELSTYEVELRDGKKNAKEKEDVNEKMQEEKEDEEEDKEEESAEEKVEAEKEKRKEEGDHEEGGKKARLN